MKSTTSQIWIRVVAKAWADEDYKARLLSDPAAVLTEEGIALPEGKSVRIVEATANETVLILPEQTEGAQSEGLEERLAAAMYF